MNIDQFTLLLQISLLAFSASSVKAPITHFVAAMSLSRVSDLIYSVDTCNVWNAPTKAGLSGWYVVSLHFIGLLVTLDFLFYYIKVSTPMMTSFLMFDPTSMADKEAVSTALALAFASMMLPGQVG